jgi:hypothetical protein
MREQPVQSPETVAAFAEPTSHMWTRLTTLKPSVIALLTVVSVAVLASLLVIGSLTPQQFASLCIVVMMLASIFWFVLLRRAGQTKQNDTSMHVVTTSSISYNSLNANHSFKYFGKEQGVSVYTFRDERDLLWHSLVFSAADRESAYVIDGLLHNDVVKSDIHSTDAFGYSEAIFATSNLIGVAYAPRFKNLKRQRRYIFRSRQSVDRSSWKIQPPGLCQPGSHH